MKRVDLSTFDNPYFERGASKLKEALWLVFGGPLLGIPLLPNGFRVFMLKRFGASIERNAVVKPGVKVKFPWRLHIGENSWVGERVWIDNLADVTIGKNVCVSQGAYLCTGSHDWGSEHFDLIIKGITIRDFCWASAFSKVGPGVVMEEGSVLALGSVATKDLAPWQIHAGNPAKPIKLRSID